MPPMSKNFVFILIMVFLVVGIVSFVSILNQNFKTIARNKELQNKILNTQLQLKEQELHYLKKQIHPHFLFNTLNTIYGFALKQSEHTPDIILKLSNLLDYILYQVDKPMVSLKEEVLHIKEYVELEKIRFKDNLSLSYNFDSIPDNLQVPPMLLIPFVENAFKHGTLKDGMLDIKLELKLDGNQLFFLVGNTLIHDENKSAKKGLGIENISKRLELHYKSNYELFASLDKDWYLTTLIIKNLKLATNE